MNSLPSFNLVFTVIFPLCFSMIFCENAIPKPVPTPTPFVVYHAKNILSGSFIPHPVSLILTIRLLFL